MTFTHVETQDDQDEDEDPTRNRLCKSIILLIKTITFFTAAKIVEIGLIFFSLITGQLFHLPNNNEHEKQEQETGFWTPLKKQIAKRVITVLFILIAVMGFLLNTVPAGLVMYSWINGSVNVFNVTYIFNVPKTVDNTNRIPLIVLRELPTKSIEVQDSLSDGDNLNEFEAYAKLVIAFLAVSSALSYVFFLYGLLCTYKLWRLLRLFVQKPKKQPEDQEPKPESYFPLDPFQYNGTITSTRLDLEESVYFIVLFLLNFGLWIACVLVFCFEHFDQHGYYTTNNSNNTIRYNDIWVEALGFGMYMYSLLCTIVSCFIFSKLAHSVTHRCLKQLKEFKKHQKKDDEVDEGLGRLIERDLQFTKMGQETTNHFEFWFTVHWIFYTVTSFLSIALLFDMIQYYIHSTLSSPNNSAAIRFSIPEIIVVALFTLQHCFLFLYPCFKAAAVTVSREKLIKKVNSHPVNPLKFSHEKKQLYIQHLKNKKFGFRISFFCARLRFGFNVAYISIFIGLLGVLLKLTGVF